MTATKFKYPKGAIPLNLNTKEARKCLDDNCTHCDHKYSRHYCWTFGGDKRTHYKCRHCKCKFAYP